MALVRKEIKLRVTYRFGFTTCTTPRFSETVLRVKMLQQPTESMRTYIQVLTQQEMSW